MGQGREWTLIAGAKRDPDFRERTHRQPGQGKDPTAKQAKEPDN